MLMDPLRRHVIWGANLSEKYVKVKDDNDLCTSECAAVVLLEKNLPRPRSPSLTTPSAVMNTLAGLMSLKIS